MSRTQFLCLRCSSGLATMRFVGRPRCEQWVRQLEPESGLPGVSVLLGAQRRTTPGCNHFGNRVGFRELTSGRELGPAAQVAVAWRRRQGG